MSPFEMAYAMEWYKKQEAKRPSNRLARANELWRCGWSLREVNLETDLWTRIPENLLNLRITDWFIVEGKRYYIDSFDFYDEVVVMNEKIEAEKKDIYDRRGQFFSLAKIEER